MTVIIVVLVSVLILSLFMGVPVGISMGLTALVCIFVFMDPSHISRFATVAFVQGTSMNQMVPPLFILMAAFLARGGIATDIYDLLSSALRRIKGGLGVATVLACTVFAALCGSSVATAASMARISVGQMVARGYKQSFASGIVAAGGTLGIMIPPSLPFILYCILTETSVAKMLIAGILPGLMLSGLFILVILIRSALDPSLIGEGDAKAGEDEEIPKELLEDGRPPEADDVKPSLKKVAATGIPAILLIFAVVGSMYSGIATPTESAGVGAIGAFVIITIRGRLNGKVFGESVAEAARTTCMLLLMMIMGLTLSYVISFLGISTRLSSFVIESGMSPWIVIVMLIVLWLILGCLMDPGSMVILTIPFVFPALMDMGFDPIWVGIISTLTVEIGMITPPVGLNLFVIKGICGIRMAPLIKGSVPFICVLLAALVILCIFPQIALFLPSRMG
ncbi:MAG: TRAP transporter large permease subunit [Clostridiales Family XIII bacterium]|jgi:tripartite ATP-independent transporter DctM subunit|nr:TRAP transporter large permease subunit [Clostridiales Family XIII bacterium]